MKIVFIHAGIEFDGAALQKGPLGGTETALIGVSRELARDPENQVYVFTNTPLTAVFDGVYYFPLRDLAGWSREQEVDVLLSIRQWLPFWLPLRARLRIYFSPDAWDQPFLQRAFEVKLSVKGEDVNVPFFPPSLFFEAIDVFYCVGRWQGDTFVDKLSFPADKIHVTANGFFPENFSPLPLCERNKNIMYSATPFRGLEHLVIYFPEIKKEYEAAGLEVCSGMQVYGMTPEDDQGQYGVLYKALRASGAVSHGPVKQSELARIMCRNAVYTYPNTFEETFCISVLEA